MLTALKSTQSFTEMCRSFGISRRSANKEAGVEKDFSIRQLVYQKVTAMVLNKFNKNYLPRIWLKLADEQCKTYCQRVKVPDLHNNRYELGQDFPTP